MITYILGCILTASFYIAYFLDDKQNIDSIADILALTFALMFMVLLWPVYWGVALAILAQEHDL